MKKEQGVQHRPTSGGFCLEEVAALDLVAVLGLGEALHQLAVLVGDHHGAEVSEAGVQTGLGGQTTHITSNSLKTLLRLDDSLVHVGGLPPAAEVSEAGVQTGLA